MIRYLSAVAAAMLLALPGCFLPSANPLHDEDCIVFRDDLVGQYKQDESTRILRKGEGKFYTIVIPGEDGDREATMQAALVKLGDEYFVDWEIPVPAGTSSEPPLKVMHMINRVTFEPGKIKFWSFKDDFKPDMPDLKLQEYTITRKLPDGNTKVEKQKLVAMAPKDLQKFVKAHAAEMSELRLVWERAADAPKK